MTRVISAVVAALFLMVSVAPETFAAPRVPSGIHGDGIVHQIKLKKKKAKKAKKKKSKKKRGKKANYGIYQRT